VSARGPYHSEAVPPLPRFAAIQAVERKQDLPDLALEGCFVAARAVECGVGQIGKTQKATCHMTLALVGPH
jgi:hypothetical protein